MTNTKVNQYLPINLTKNQTSIHILLIKKVTKTSMQVYNNKMQVYNSSKPVSLSVQSDKNWNYTINSKIVTKKLIRL